jgi:integrase
LRIVPWTVERVHAVIEAHPERYRAVPIVAAGLGLRQGETFGLGIDDMDFLRRKVVVRRQVKILNGSPTLAHPKVDASARFLSPMLSQWRSPSDSGVTRSETASYSPAVREDCSTVNTSIAGFGSRLFRK